MLKGNLATRPFYNERLVTVALGVVAIAAVLLTAYDVKRLMDLSARRTAATARLDADRRETTRIRGQAEALQQTVDRPTLGRLSAATREANTLIDQRTFSWTRLFSLLESTLPPDVKLVSISPRQEKGTSRVTMMLVLRQLEDVHVFCANLRDTGAFYDVSPTDSQRQDDGTYSAQVDASYLPRPTPPAAHASTGREKQQ